MGRQLQQQQPHQQQRNYRGRSSSSNSNRSSSSSGGGSRNCEAAAATVAAVAAATSAAAAVILKQQQQRRRQPQFSSSSGGGSRNFEAAADIVTLRIDMCSTDPCRSVWPCGRGTWLVTSVCPPCDSVLLALGAFLACLAFCNCCHLHRNRRQFASYFALGAAVPNYVMLNNSKNNM